MSEMVERVAMAMCKEAFGSCPCADGATDIKRDCQDKRRYALAAIEAMREPTDAMVEQMQQAVNLTLSEGQFEYLSRDEIVRIWQGGIDEALK